MTDNIDRLYEPDKDEGDYFEFITLSGGPGAFDIEDADYWCGRHDMRLDELVFRTQEGRWVLVYAPGPGHENYEAPQPLSRELTPAEAARWFQINRRKLPEGLIPVRPIEESEGTASPTRLDREWRPPSRPMIDHAGPVADMSPLPISEASPTTPTDHPNRSKPTKAKPQRRRDGAQAAKVIGYLVLYLESSIEAQRSGQPIEPLETQAQIAKRLKVSEATVSRAGRRWLKRYRAQIRPEMVRGWKNKDGQMDAW